MNPQLEMFSEVMSFPPHLDPAKVEEVKCWADIDRDHVGEEEIGKLGNNKAVWVVKVYDRDGAVLFAEQFADRDQAETLRESILVKLQQNQRSLFQ